MLVSPYDTTPVYLFLILSFLFLRPADTHHLTSCPGNGEIGEKDTNRVCDT